MAYSEELAQRMRDVIGPRDGIAERRMFGGIVWLLDGNMAVGTFGEDMMVRLARDDAQAALGDPHVRPMESGGRRMRGFVIVAADAVTADEELGRWIDAGTAFAASLTPK